MPLPVDPPVTELRRKICGREETDGEGEIEEVIFRYSTHFMQ